MTTSMEQAGIALQQFSEAYAGYQRACGEEDVAKVTADVATAQLASARLSREAADGVAEAALNTLLQALAAVGVGPVVTPPPPLG